MLTIVNKETNKKYEITKEMEQVINTTKIQMEAIANGVGVDVAVANAYGMNIALSSFLQDIKNSNEGKKIEDLLGLKEVE